MFIGKKVTKPIKALLCLTAFDNAILFFRALGNNQKETKAHDCARR